MSNFKKESSIGQTFIKIKHKVKWMVKAVKTRNSPPLPSYVHSFVSTTKHFEKIQLHMFFTLHVNILKKFDKPKFNKFMSFISNKNIFQ